MIKFRTMLTDADNQRLQVMQETGGDSRLFKDRQDRRITRTGAWLRKFSIDEVPQIWNVFRGEMAFVGPRPPLPREVAEYQTWHQQRLLVRPGMTGLWQVSGRSDLSFDQMVRLDLYYAENWSLWLDLKILLRTIPAVILGRGAY
jgi:lipopolysaccharide/colanic/teichoic acid biosynthesis glycosyltransferase